MTAHQTPVIFRGRTSEYFGIWIVNLLLSMITLGIYSAWAKVRRKKYFYNNTLIDGVGFDYHASPIAILKGRIIAFLLFVSYQVLSAFSPIAAGVLFIIFMIALPWIVVRGLVFNARNSSHRGLRFNFDGQYGEAALVFIGYSLLTIVTLGLAIPFVAQRTHQFVISHHKFGLNHFKMEALVKDFYKIYLILFIIPIIGILAAVAIPQYAKYKEKASHASVHQTQVVTQTLVNFAPNAEEGGFIKVASTEPITTEVENITKQATASDEALTAAEQAELDAIESEALTSADERLTDEDMTKDLSPEERAEYDRLMKDYEAQSDDGTAVDTDAADKPKSELDKALDPLALALGGAFGALAILIGILLYLAIIFSFVAYLKSRVSNLVLNNTNIDHVSFHSNQRMRDLLWIYISNALVLMFTMGLATPWAQIRLAKYRADHLNLAGETDWDKFVGEKKEATKATGEEIADFFDVDLSFGF